MTDHTPLPVSGYKPQNDANIQLVNTNKNLEEMVLLQLDTYKGDASIDQRWLAIGRTNLELAFMAINRAIFQPERAKIKE